MVVDYSEGNNRRTTGYFKKAYNGIVRQEFSEYFDRLIVDYPVNKIIVQNFERSAKNIIISEIL